MLFFGIRADRIQENLFVFVCVAAHGNRMAAKSVAYLTFENESVDQSADYYSNANCGNDDKPGVECVFVRGIHDTYNLILSDRFEIKTPGLRYWFASRALFGSIKVLRVCLLLTL